VTVGERGQIVIPAEARKEHGIEVGDKLLVFSDRGRITLMRADDVLQFVESRLANLTNLKVLASKDLPEESETEPAPEAPAKDHPEQGSDIE
jgi:AbrB family looped-hinge helix DNA binding protein